MSIDLKASYFITWFSEEEVAWLHLSEVQGCAVQGSAVECSEVQSGVVQCIENLNLWLQL